MKKITSEELPTKEDQELKKVEFALKFEAINKIVTSPGWKYVKEIFQKNINDGEMEKLLASKGVDDFEKVGKLVWIEHRANKKIEKAFKELDSYNVRN